MEKSKEINLDLIYPCYCCENNKGNEFESPCGECLNGIENNFVPIQVPESAGRW